MKAIAKKMGWPRGAAATRGDPHRVRTTRLSSRGLPAARYRVAKSRRRKTTNALGVLAGKVLLLLTGVLMVVAVVQKPSMLLLFFIPTAMAATAVRLLLGLLLAAAIKTCVSNVTPRSRTLLSGRLRILLALALTIALLALLCNIFGSAPFRKLGADDVVMHKAYVTQLVAFTLLWLALLR